LERYRRRCLPEKPPTTVTPAPRVVIWRRQGMRRRDVLAGAGVTAVSNFPAPSLAQGFRQLTMVTDWPETLPGLQTSAVRFAQTVDAASDGRVKIKVFPAGALVRAFETFDAVSAGVADMYPTYEGYFEAKAQAFHFFTAL